MTAHHPDAEEGCRYRNDTICDIADQCGFRREACLRKDLRAIIHDGIDTGNLLADRDAHCDKDDTAYPWLRKILHGRLLHVGLLGKIILDLIEFSNRTLFITCLLQNLQRFTDFPMHNEPAWALRHCQHTKPEHNCRQGCNGKHIPPDMCGRTKGYTNDSIQHKCTKLTSNDHELILRNHTAPPFCRRHFGQIGRHRH